MIYNNNERNNSWMKFSGDNPSMDSRRYKQHIPYVVKLSGKSTENGHTSGKHSTEGANLSG